MTFGVIATKSLQRISGAESYEVGFAPPNSSWMNEEQNLFYSTKPNQEMEMYQSQENSCTFQV